MVPSLFALLGTAIPLGIARAQGADSAPFPNAYYPGFEDPNTDAGAQSFQTSPPFYPSPWVDGSGDWGAAVARARAFVSQLTLAEKVNLTTGVGWEGDQCVGNTGSVPRLNFRALCLEDSPLGVRDTDYVTAFPAGVTIAASWDRNLAYQRGVGMGYEHFHKGVDAQLGPVVGPLGRAPEGGRNWEGFSPDPVLSGILVAETVKGIQSSGVIATTKHYILNEQEHFRSDESSNIDDITLHELYLWPFADAVRAGTGSIMCSYNQVNSSYSCQNSYTLNKLLKSELGFQGFVMSDWSAQHSGVSSALAGLDMTMPGDEGFDSGNSFWGANLTVAVLNGTVPEWRIDDMVTRILAAWYYVGRGDNNPPEPNFSAWTLETVGPRYFESGTGIQVINEHVNVQANHASQALTQAIRGTVLLKNTNNALPLNGSEKFLAIIGEDARLNPEGLNTVPGCSDHGCDIGTMAMGWGSGTDNFPFLISPEIAITQYAVNHGTQDVVSSTDNYNIPAIVAVASQASVAVVFANTDSGEGYITVDGNEGDRNNLTLWQGADTVIANVTQVCNNVILVIHSVGPVLMEEYANNPNITAIVWANVPGEQSGNAIVDILYGNSNPGGKLPYTLGATRESYGTDVLYYSNYNGTNQIPQLNFAEGVYIDYRAFDKHNETPVYEFGFGLSYTTFSFSNLQIQANSHTAYTPTTGDTAAAPVLGSPGSIASALFPAGFVALKDFIYSYLNSSNLATASGDSTYGENSSAWLPPNAQDGSAQPRNPAGGAPGGNPALYDVLYTVTATIKNTGPVTGDEVPQLYLNLGGPNDPVRVLRNFDRLTIAPGQTAQFVAQITRRDLSNWDPASQNWIITSYPKTVYVGNSSRNLPLVGTLDLSSINGTTPSGGSGGSAWAPPGHQTWTSAQPVSTAWTANPNPSGWSPW